MGLGSLFVLAASIVVIIMYMLYMALSQGTTKPAPTVDFYLHPFTGEGTITIINASGRIDTLRYYDGPLTFHKTLKVYTFLDDNSKVHIEDICLNNKSLFKKAPRHYSWQDKASYSLELLDTYVTAIPHDTIEYISDMIKHIDEYNEYVDKHKLRWAYADDEYGIQFYIAH